MSRPFDRSARREVRRQAVVLVVRPPFVVRPVIVPKPDYIPSATVSPGDVKPYWWLTWRSHGGYRRRRYATPTWGKGNTRASVLANGGYQSNYDPYRHGYWWSW